MANKADRKRRQALLWRLLLLPFLLLGLALLGLAGVKVAQHLDAQSWQPAQATLLERGASAQTRVGGATRRTATYLYHWQGRYYESTQLSFFAASASTQIDDWEARIDARLGRPGEQFTVWVDPRQPSDAVVVRELRWLEIGAMVGFGLALTAAACAFLFNDTRTAPARTAPASTAPTFSWRAVGALWVLGLGLGLLAALLWRDGHPVWAGLAALPALLAAHGTLHGLRRRPSNPES